jgi:hypothetical protein
MSWPVLDCDAFVVDESPETTVDPGREDRGTREVAAT